MRVASLAVQVAVMALLAPLVARGDGGRMMIADFRRGPDGPDAPKGRSGIFRDGGQPIEQQFISEDLTRLALPNGEESGFLRLAYRLEAPGTFNGWWVKVASEAARGPKEVDWSAYRSG